MSVRAVDPGPVTLLVQRRDHRLLLEALRELTVEEQTILELHYWEALKTEEIADVLGIPVGTARGRLQRSRGRLAEIILRLSNSSQDLATTVACLEDWAKGCRGQLDNYRSST
jgi:RNA polymerase sigma-70 factor (ECF subfamily)